MPAAKNPQQLTAMIEQTSMLDLRGSIRREGHKWGEEGKSRMNSSMSDLGFEYKLRKSGVVEIFHDGRPVTILRGQAAAAFLADVDEMTGAEIQQVLARKTGNYKRGNERSARNHPRNREG